MVKDPDDRSVKRFFPLGAPWKKKLWEVYLSTLKKRFAKPDIGESAVDYLQRVIDRQINKARGLLTYNALLFTAINLVIVARTPAGEVALQNLPARLALILTLISCIPLLVIFYLSWGTVDNVATAGNDFSTAFTVLRQRTYLLTLSIYATLIATLIALGLVVT